MANPSLKNQVAIVTGGASGIGLATVKRLAAEGAAVLIADRRSESIAAAKSALAEEQPDARIGSFVCDVSRAEDVEGAVQETLRRYDKVDIIVNNAGLMIFKSLEDHTLEDWSKVLAVDLLGAFLFIQQGFKVMRGGGAIVNVSSVHAVETTANVAAYAAAKAALVSLTHTAAIEGKAKNIRVNAVLPGAIDTPMLWSNPNVKSGLEQIQRADVGKPEEVAAVIAFLASAAASFVRGSAVRVDGGRLSHL